MPVRSGEKGDLMNISADMVDYIRTMVSGEHEANDAIEARLDEDGWGDFATLLGAVFFLAVDRRFGEGADRGVVMKFVSKMRSEIPVDPSYIDANSAESLIMAALDPAVGHDVEPEMKGRIQGAVISYVLGAPDMTNENREAVYAEAMQMAARL
jgi:hypothetical protein